MLHQLLAEHREELLERCRAKAVARDGVVDGSRQAEPGLAAFLDQLTAILRAEHAARAALPRDGVTSETTLPSAPIARSAADHGAVMQRSGYSVDQLVHSYGDICQSITDFIVDEQMTISAHSSRTLNRCLDEAIAESVTAFGTARQQVINWRGESLNGQLALFAREHRRLAEVAAGAFAAIRDGSVGLTGATSTVLVLALRELGSLTDRTLPELRLQSAVVTTPDIPLA